jgi:hypothetical protein
MTAPRFGIGEWYGRSFVNLSAQQRRTVAQTAIAHSNATAPVCPFRSSAGQQLRCNKKGGICSLRLYNAAGDNGEAVAATGPTGILRVTCPERFKQDNIAFRAAALAILETDQPQIVKEVRFLHRESSPETDDSGGGHEDVGNIDIVLVHPSKQPLSWCALEIQAVYFSGVTMRKLFEHIRDFPTDGIPFPDSSRRPDYRSSGPKRLMPQLQIKVPTLRRWGKKMAVIVDTAWFQTNVIGVPEVSDLSNCDVAWFLVSFDETTDPATITIGEPAKQTLERAVEGLTGGFPVTLNEFEAKIIEKLAPS